MKKVIATCPASVSLLFKFCPNKNLVKMGSVGVGFTIDRWVQVSVQLSRKSILRLSGLKAGVCSGLILSGAFFSVLKSRVWAPSNVSNILFNGKPIVFPTVASVINYLTEKKVCTSVRSNLPLGFGFGISSASALATAFAVNKLLKLNKQRDELVKLAHIAEITNKTGLGSVGTQVTGGFLLKTSPGIPVSAKKFPFAGKKIYAVIIGRLETPRILNSPIKIQKINQAADLTIQIINKLTHPTLEQFIDLSYQSAKVSGLLNNPEVMELISEIRISGGHATMAMLGNIVISNIKPKTNYRIEELRITDKGIS